uniref:Uncharacterized protein n=1 Tax=Anopheles atroparvus TaxID=41427 RepID=A0AAG5DAH5_ANOAO
MDVSFFCHHSEGRCRNAAVLMGRNLSSADCRHPANSLTLQMVQQVKTGDGAWKTNLRQVHARKSTSVSKEIVPSLMGK